MASAGLTRLSSAGGRAFDDDADADETSFSATQKAVDAITQGIRGGAFAPGQHLVESDLTRRLRISRGGLREAFRQLAAAGVLTLRHHRGAYVDLLDLQGLVDFLELLEPLIRLAARLAAERCATDEQRAQMLSVAHRAEQAARRDGTAAHREQCRQYYDVLVELADNRELARVVPLSRTDIMRAQVEHAYTVPQRLRLAAGYRTIADAVLDQDPAAADEAVTLHFAEMRKVVAELPASAFLGWGCE